MVVTCLDVNIGTLDLLLVLLAIVPILNTVCRRFGEQLNSFGPFRPVCLCTSSASEYGGCSALSSSSYKAVKVSLCNSGREDHVQGGYCHPSSMRQSWSGLSYISPCAAKLKRVRTSDENGLSRS